MSHLQYMPGDPRLVDQLVCELKSKGIFDQFRKECIADVDTRPAYQNLRQRVESSVASFLSRQCWKPDLNKNQLREKLRKHLLDGNYLEQGVERIVDQVVNPKVASVFIPQVEDLVYNYLGIPRKKTEPETSNGKIEDLLPTDLEAVSPGSVKSNDDMMEIDVVKDDDDDDKPKADMKDDSVQIIEIDKEKNDGESRLSGMSELTIHDSDVSIDKTTMTIPLPAEEIKLENIPAPENSPPNIKNKNIDLEKIDLPQEPNLSTDIPLPDEMPKAEGDTFFKPINSEDSFSSDSSVRRNVSPLTPIRNFNNENSCDAQQAFENESDSKSEEKKEPSSFRFTIEAKATESSPDIIKNEDIKEEKKEDKKEDPMSFVNAAIEMNTFNPPSYDDSSNSNNLQIDYESDANSKATDVKPEPDQNSGDSSKKEKKDDRRSSHKSSHRSRDSHRHSSSKDKRSESKHSSSRDSSRHDKKKDDKSKSKESEKPSEKSEKKDSKESSKHRSSSSYKSSSSKDSKHRSSSSSKHTSKDEKKPSSSHKEREKSSSKDKAKDTKSSRDKDKKSSSKKSDEKENKDKKDKKETDDHYSLSGRGNPNRRSTDRDSNDGSSSSKGSHNPSHSKTTESKKGGKNTKTDNTYSGDSSSPSDAVEVNQAKTLLQHKKVVRVDTRLETPVAAPPILPFVPDVRLKKPRFASNLKEAKEMIKMRKFFEDEQKRMNQEAALLLEFQANVRPSLSQVYSSIPGPELEFACVSNAGQPTDTQMVVLDEPVPNSVERQNLTDNPMENNHSEEIKLKITQEKHDEIAQTLIAMHQESNNINRVKIEENTSVLKNKSPEPEQNKESIIEVLSDDDNEIEEKYEIKEESKEVKTQSVNKTENVSENVEPIEEKVEITETAPENKNIKLENESNHVENEDANELIEVLIEIKDIDEDSLQKEIVDICERSGERNPLHYFAEHEKFNAEIERNKFTKFLKAYDNLPSDKLYLVNCDTYEENLIKEMSKEFGDFEVVNYFKNGHVKLPKDTNIVKNVNLASEITLPAKIDNHERPITPHHSPIFSPVKSECSFELSSDYDAKLEEMVNKTSRQEIMEIILGSVVDDSSNVPQIDYCMESSIEEVSLKRKLDTEINVNNNRQVLTPNKLRKLSGSEIITSTTEESGDTLNNRVQNNIRSKYLGKAKRVGLPRPKKTTLPNSPSSDKSVENYEQNETPNGKIKAQRNKVQRYDTSDLYKPKLHYLSRRNNIS